MLKLDKQADWKSSGFTGDSRKTLTSAIGDRTPQGGLGSSSSFIVECSLKGDFSFEVVLGLFADLSLPSSACVEEEPAAVGSDGVEGERDLDERFDVPCTSGWTKVDGMTPCDDGPKVTIDPVSTTS